jgi:hypothetical protein
MKPDDLAKLKDAFRKSVENCETPDRPMLFVGPRCLSVRQFADEVINETEIGRDILAYQEELLKQPGKTIEGLCAWIENYGRPDAPPKP